MVTILVGFFFYTYHTIYSYLTTSIRFNRPQVFRDVYTEWGMRLRKTIDVSTKQMPLQYVILPQIPCMLSQ